MSAFKCPNCGGSEKQNLTPERHQCIYCQTVFDNPKKQTGNNTVNSTFFIRDEANYQDEYETSSRGALATILTFLVIIGLVSIFSMAAPNRDVNESIRAAEMERYQKETQKIIDEQMRQLLPPDSLMYSFQTDSLLGE